MRKRSLWFEGWQIASGERLRVLMHERGVTQMQLAEKIAISRATVTVLDINDPQRVHLRIEFGEVGG